MAGCKNLDENIIFLQGNSRSSINIENWPLEPHMTLIAFHDLYLGNSVLDDWVIPF